VIFIYVLVAFDDYEKRKIISKYREERLKFYTFYQQLANYTQRPAQHEAYFTGWS
jgi:hypothetical protein